jgi:hypothetical protein
VTITKSISIISNSIEAGVLVSGTNGIIVNVQPTDKVLLEGLDIEGLGTGLNGVTVHRRRKDDDPQVFDPELHAERRERSGYG